MRKDGTCSAHRAKSRSLSPIRLTAWAIDYVLAFGSLLSRSRRQKLGDTGALGSAQLIRSNKSCAIVHRLHKAQQQHPGRSNYLNGGLFLVPLGDKGLLDDAIAEEGRWEPRTRRHAAPPRFSVLLFPIYLLVGTVLSPIRICVRGPRGLHSARLNNFFFGPLQCDKMINSVSGVLQWTLDIAPSICLLPFSTVA